MNSITRMVKKKPKFIRYNSEYLKKLSSSWRRPRGIHNKVRQKEKGHPRMPSIGYGSPKQFYSLYKSEFDYTLIKSEKDLENLNKKYVILSGNLGQKAKLNLVNKLKQLNVKILNIKDVDKFIKDAEEKLKSKKEKKTLEQKKKEERAKEREEKAKIKEKKEPTHEEKLEQEKLEKKKVLEGAQ